MNALNAQIRKELEEAAENLSPEKLVQLQTQINTRLAISNQSFLREVRNISLTSVTAAPFSLTLLQTGLNIDIAWLVCAFIFLMTNVLFLNIGIRFVNSRFRNSTASQFLEVASIELYSDILRDKKLEDVDRLSALTGILDSESELEKKAKLEPYQQEKILESIRRWGLILFGIGIGSLILSVLLPIALTSNVRFLITL